MSGVTDSPEPKAPHYHDLLLPSADNKNHLVASRVGGGNKGVVDRKGIGGLEHVRVVSRAKDVLLASLPLWLVDGVNPILDLHDQAAVLLHDTGAVSVVEETLSFLERKTACKRL